MERFKYHPEKAQWCLMHGLNMAIAHFQDWTGQWIKDVLVQPWLFMVNWMNTAGTMGTTSADF